MAATRKIRNRICVVFAFLVILLAGVITRLFYLQVLDYERYVQLAQEQSRGNLLTLPVRGKIFVRNLNTLAESIDTKSVVMTASKFDPESESLKRVSDVLDISLEHIHSQQGGSTHLTYLKRKLGPEELSSTQELWNEE